MIVSVCDHNYSRWLSVKWFNVDVCVYSICTFLIVMTELVLF